MKENFEIRTMPVTLELRKTGKNPVVYGKAAVYNSKSNPLGTGSNTWIETIEPGFFSSVLNQDVLATVEHNTERLVGRTKSGTLKLKDTPQGLTTENVLPDTAAGNDLKILIERGDIRGMSFAFTVKKGGDQWRTDKATGSVTRTLKSGGCQILHDVTYTSDPAYSDTTIAMRSMEKLRGPKLGQILRDSKALDVKKVLDRERKLAEAQDWDRNHN
jgi:HK97 family phage prohead protease